MTLNGENNQFWRRTFIRTSFSLVEGFCILIREKCLPLATTCDERGGINLTDVYFLGEVGYRIKDNGTLEQEPQRFPFINRVAFSIRMFAKYAKVHVDICSGSGWQQFRNAVKIRNRLTHPSSVSDLSISDEDMTIIHSGVNWFFGHVVAVIHQTTILNSDAEMPLLLNKRK